MVNNLHLLNLHSCPNHPICLCFLPNLYLAIPHHNLWAFAHSQLHHCSHHLTFHFPKHPLPDLLLKIQRLHPLSLFPENVKIPKRSSIHAFFISTDALLNSAWNRTRSHGSCLTYKPVWLKHGKNISWLKSLRRLSGTTRRMSSYRKFNDSSAIQTREP